MVRKMYECDMQYGKIHRIIKNNETELNAIKDTIWAHYRNLKTIYVNCTSQSTFPVISWNDFTTFCYKVISESLKLCIVGHNR